jgi:hypothetical protein
MYKPRYKHSQIDAHIDDKSLHRAKDNINAHIPPGRKDDKTRGYEVGSRWLFNGNYYVSTRSESGKAVWTLISGPTKQEQEQEQERKQRGEWLLREEKSIGTNGGNFIKDVWQVRQINTIAFASDDSVQVQDYAFDITQKGFYSFSISAPAFQVKNHQVRLVDVDTDEVIAYSRSEFANNATLDWSLQIDSVPRRFRIEHRCAETRLSDGMGLSSGFGGNEIYTTVRIERK